jgi:hypothetical protein
MAPQGRRGAGAAAAGAAAGAGLAAVLFMPCPGAAGVAGAPGAGCDTLLDCLPKDLPPPMRLAASAWLLKSTRATDKTTFQIFMLSPKTYLLST